jgi:hypothetical protein
VTDVGGESTVVDGSAIIADAPLTAAPVALAPHTGVALPATTVVATFTDANTFATTADYTTSIDWGDGSPESTGVVVPTAIPGVFDVEGGHTYAKPNALGAFYTTLVTVHDDGGSQLVVPGKATVTDLPVTGTVKTSPRSRARTPARSCWRRSPTPTPWRRSPTLQRRSRSTAGATARP